MKKPKKSFVLRRFQISKLTKLCCVFARYIWCGHSQTHPRLLRSQVKKGLGARLTSAIHWNSKKVMDMIQLLRALPGELFGKHMGFCMGFFAWSQPPARPETSPMRRLQMASNHHPQRLCVRQKSLDLAGECTLMFPLKVQRIFTSAGTCCFFQKQIWAVTNKTTYIYIILCYILIWLKLALSQHKVPYLYLLTWVLYMARYLQAVVRLGLSRSVGMFWLLGTKTRHIRTGGVSGFLSN